MAPASVRPDNHPVDCGVPLTQAETSAITDEMRAFIGVESGPRSYEISAWDVDGVTGATGLLGGYLIRALLRRGADPIAVVRNPQSAAALRSLGVEVRTADLGDDFKHGDTKSHGNSAVCDSKWRSVKVLKC